MLNELMFVNEILVAHSFEKGKQLVLNVQPDIILLDIHLPDKSGIDLLKIVKTDFSTIKVLMVTNKVSPYYKELCMDLGADYFIDKSKEFENIPQILDKYYST